MTMPPLALYPEPLPRPSRLGVLLLLGSALLLAGCVTERPSRSSPSRAGAATSPSTEKPRLPDGPIATPVPSNASMTSRLNFRLLPLGTVPYDGQVLPLISPDGQYGAVEQGDAPTWPTLLAQPDATHSPGTRVGIFNLKQTPMREVVPAEPLPRGVVLGRSSDSRGCLVEWPRPDGSRWIGRAVWAGTKMEWLVQGSDVNAHAVIGPDGTLAYTHRAVGGVRSELVVNTPEGASLVFAPPDGSCCFPIIAPGGRVVCTLVLSNSGLEIVALRVKNADGTRPRSFGPPLASRVLSSSGDLTLAYQTVAGVPCAPVDGAKEPVGAEEAVLFFHPGLQRMAAFWWRDGAIMPLTAGSIAAAQTPLIDPPGFFQTTPEGLMFSAMPADINAGTKAARLMEASYVPRATNNQDRPLILIGPANKRDPSLLTIVAFSVLPPPAPVE